MARPPSRSRCIARLALSTAVSSALAALLVFSAVELNLGLRAGPHLDTELAIVFVLEVLIAVGSAIVIGIIVLAGGARVAVSLGTILLATLLVGALAGVEIFGQTASGSIDFTKSEELARDLPFLLLVGLPGLLTLMIEWWTVHRLFPSDAGRRAERGTPS
jgi:hypothetical protein